MRYAFAGDRQISCDILKFIIEKGYKPLALLVSKGKNASHSSELKKISGLTDEYIFENNAFKKAENFSKLKELNLDYIIGIHFPYVIPTEILNIPKLGFLNLHPAYLPYNKGWNTPSWAIIDQTPYGATLHFMAEELDAGDIIHQKQLRIESYDTANSLYQKTLQLEKDVFIEAFDDISNLYPNRKLQQNEGTSYKKSDLEKVQQFNLEDTFVIKEFLNKLRALSTNSDDELAYYLEDNRKIGVRVEFIDLNN